MCNICMKVLSVQSAILHFTHFNKSICFSECSEAFGRMLEKLHFWVSVRVEHVTIAFSNLQCE